MCPCLGDGHPVARECPGLVGADDARRAERLDRRDPFDEGALPGEEPDAHSERESDGREQALGNVGDDKSDREVQRIGKRQPGQQCAQGYEGETQPHCHDGDEAGDPPHLLLERALLMPTALGQRRDPAELGAHSGGIHHRGDFPGDAGGAAEDEIARKDQRHVTVSAVGAHRYRGRFPGQRGGVDLCGPIEQASVSGNAITLGDDDDVAGHQFPRVDFGFVLVADHPGTLGKVGGKCFDGLFGVAFLYERERGVESDDHDDRDRQRHRTRQCRKRGSDPQQQCERMKELPAQGTPPSFAGAANQFVRAGQAEAPLRVASGQTGSGRSQIA